MEMDYRGIQDMAARLSSSLGMSLAVTKPRWSASKPCREFYSKGFCHNGSCELEHQVRSNEMYLKFRVELNKALAPPAPARNSLDVYLSYGLAVVADISISGLIFLLTYFSFFLLFYSSTLNVFLLRFNRSI